MLTVTFRAMIKYLTSYNIPSSFWTFIKSGRQNNLPVFRIAPVGNESSASNTFLHAGWPSFLRRSNCVLIPLRAEIVLLAIKRHSNCLIQEIRSAYNFDSRHWIDVSKLSRQQTFVQFFWCQPWHAISYVSPIMSSIYPYAIENRLH